MQVNIKLISSLVILNLITTKLHTGHANFKIDLDFFIVLRSTDKPVPAIKKEKSQAPTTTHNNPDLDRTETVRKEKDYHS
jgi:hypothetical protein